MQAQIILYIHDVALLLGKTEAAVTSAYQRGQIPGAFKMLGRVAWKRETIENWIEGHTSTQSTEKPKRGRKRKAYEVEISPAYQPNSQH